MNCYFVERVNGYVINETISTRIIHRYFFNDVYDHYRLEYNEYNKRWTLYENYTNNILGFYFESSPKDSAGSTKLIKALIEIATEVDKRLKNEI